MDLELVSKFFYQLLSGVHAESYLNWNNSTEVRYPYLTYEFDYQPIDDLRTQFSVELRLFDYGTSKKNLIQLESKLNKALHKQYVFNDDLNAYIRVERSMDMPTGNEKILRRDIYLTIKIDMKNGGIN